MHADSSSTLGSSLLHTNGNFLVRIRATVPGSGGQGSLNGQKPKKGGEALPLHPSRRMRISAPHGAVRVFNQPPVRWWTIAYPYHYRAGNFSSIASGSEQRDRDV